MSAEGRTLGLEAFPPEARATIARLAEAGAADAWLVGGAVRDALAGARPRELDVAIPAGALARGRALADRLGARFVVLDEDRGVARLVGTVSIDLADFRAPSIEDDLAARDFTVNAIAAPLPALAGGRAPLLDPTGGLADLAARVVRLCGPRALVDDPLRILRAVRLALGPGWRLDPGVMGAARAAAPGLVTVAAERTRDELARILDGPAAAGGLRLLDDMGALAVLLPEREPMQATPQPLPHHFDVWEHSLRAVAAADRLLAEAPTLARWGREIAARADEDLGDGLTRRAAVKLAALLHDVAKPETRTEEPDGRVRFIGHDVIGAARVADIAERWRLSRRAGAMLERLVRHHLRPMHLAQSGPITRRARHRFFRDLGDDAGELLLLALADAAGLRGDDPLQIWEGEGGRVLRELQAGAAEERALAAAPPLVTGEDVMAAFGLPSGPAVGRLLARAREAQALGQVATREEALALLARDEMPPLDTPESGS